MNEAAQALGRKGRGCPHLITEEERQRRRTAAAGLVAVRWARYRALAGVALHDNMKACKHLLKCVNGLQKSGARVGGSACRKVQPSSLQNSGVCSLDKVRTLVGKKKKKSLDLGAVLGV